MGAKHLAALLLALAMLVPELGIVAFASDIATPSAKAKQSAEYSPHSAWELGYTGKGVALCIMDTGIDNQHPSLVGKWLGGADISKPQTPWWPRDGSFDADDTNGHGTTCAGISTGTGAPEMKYQGTAPDARLVDLRIGTKVGYAPGEGPFSFYDASLQAEAWALAHKDDDWPSGGGEYKGIDVLSLSWGVDVGGSSDGSDAYSAGLDKLVDAGVICVVAAGNDGPANDGFTGMGAASNVITIGATDDLDTIDRSDDIIASYSSRGPRKDNGDDDPYNELKPDVSASGTHINQAEFDQVGDGSGNGYGSRGSGTSYATPLVAGVCALMLQANHNITPYIAKEILRMTSERRGNASEPETDPFWNRDFGWGIVDAYLACRMTERIKDVSAVDIDLQCFVTNVTVKDGKVVASGLTWNRRGDVEKTEIKMDNGSWMKVVPSKSSPFGNWSAQLDATGLSAGNHTIYIRSWAGGKTSLISEKELASPAGIFAKGGVVVSGAMWGAGIAVAAVVAFAGYRYYKKKRTAAS